MTAAACPTRSPAPQFGVVAQAVSPAFSGRVRFPSYCLRRLRQPRRTVEEPAHNFGLLSDIDQERVMPVIRLQIAIRNIAIDAPQNAHNLLRLITGIKPVGSEADHEETRVDSTES